MIERRKVCFLIPSVKSGGIETYLLRFLQFADGRLDATILVRNKDKGELFQDYKDTGAKILFKPLGYFNLSSIKWYYHFFKQQEFETICDFNANFAGLVMLLARILGTKKRITFYRQSSHHFKQSSLKLLYVKLLNRLVLWNSTSILSNSEAAFIFFFPSDYHNDIRFKVIKNGVYLNHYLGLVDISKSELRQKLHLPLDKKIIGHVGRFAEAKNHMFILNVAAELIKRNNLYYFILIGNETSKLQPIVNKMNISENIQILSYTKNIPEYLRSFDLFFFPSITEGQPNALIEAMATGLKIVASDIPSIRECLPVENWDCLIDPTKVSDAVDKIQSKIEYDDIITLQTHVKQHFNSEKQFQLFFENL